MGGSNRYVSVSTIGVESLAGGRWTKVHLQSNVDLCAHFLCFLMFGSTPYTPLEKKCTETTDEDTTTDDWSLDQPLAQTRTTAIVEVKGAVDVVLTPLVAEALDR